ncbi:hypothetical protein MYCTH_97015 [Thermothelomyces thermophilus ATCC 42464]|uniref:Chromatin modification-related protein n=1 Tax=Thermothelomyces thermophilus (strain ATCC 42464 / BCRC 31852 / DSM 1799) TaxID=573729 RepID=G2QP91_THET4|nr:uncharacterized protein MYCTH_97015 [Thermothelomyces thermophilus ATCC 42464]AEO61404.1 hypothetical protein MYCTH_97015 [Thermothelomyces thermophilus ATCC 42464]
MKTAKPPAPEGVTGSSRRQPVRQTRVNPPRTSSLNRNNPLAGAPASEQPINILPGVTHFADAITALPRELVRHFTLLKEVDAKIFAPEAALLQLLHDALNTPPPDLSRPVNDALSSTASVSAPMSTTGPANPAAPPSDATTSSVFDPANIPRRTLFRDTALKIQEILVSLEEKNHVLATANDALQKQLARIEDIWPHLEAEFSEEAKWGSATHWAYVENRQAKANDKQAERSRREGAATLSAAAQALAEEAAARSSDRKQAIAAKKNAKNQAADADSDKVQDSGKRAQGTKSRKPLPDHGPVGLGITSAPSGGASASKRRKVAESKSNGATAERAMGSVFGANSTRRGTTSPTETPAPEGGNKKRKALPTSSSQAKKSRTNAAMSPSVTSSPVVGALPDPVKPGRASPAPSATASRPASSRARQNSTHSNVDNSRQRLPSVASNKPSGNSQGTPDPAQPSNGAKTSTDSKTQKEATVPIMNKPSPLKTETEEPPSAPEPAQDDNDDNSARQTDEQPAQSNKEAAALGTQSTPASGVKTKSGRASKPSTPAISTFAEAASSNSSATTSRSRPSRGAENSANNATSGTAASNQSNTTTAKRSHKKGASVSTSATAVAQAAAAATSSSSTSAGTSSSGALATTAAGKDKERDRDRGSGPGVSASGTTPAASGGRKDKANSGSSSGGTGNTSNNNNAGARKAGAGAENEDDADEDDDQDVADEDVYCYCNQVSYGEMVACDGEGCPREWFHLECVGLKVAPKGNAKWYCEDCKKRLKITERR